VYQLVVSRLQETLVVFALFVLQAGQLGYALRADGMTFDELLYIASGYRQLTLGDHRFGAEHPPLARLLAAVPLLPLDLKVRDLSASDASLGWDWAYQFVQVDNIGSSLLARSRLPIACLSLLLSLGLWKLSRDAWGKAAGVTALALSSLHPSLLAHGHLVTTDMAGAVTMIGASWALWKWCEAPGVKRALLVGSAL
jgi:hypothetical protein